MVQNEANKELVFRYLLGNLGEEEEERYEELYFANPDALEELQLLREELIEDYLRGDLNKEDRMLFEQNFLASPTHVQKVEITKAFMSVDQEQEKAAVASPSLNSFEADETSAFYASNFGLEKVVASAVDKSQRHSGSQPIFAFFRLHSRKFVWAAIVVLLVSIGFLVLRGVFNESSVSPDVKIANDNANRINVNQATDQQATQQKENQNLNQNNRNESLPPIKKPDDERERLQPHVAVFLLTHGSKSSGDEQTFVIEPASQFVQLQITQTTDGYKKFRLSISQASGAQITAQTVVPTPSQSIVLNLPARLFSSGEYVLRLDGIAVQGKLEEVDKYFFKVEKKEKPN